MRTVPVIVPGVHSQHLSQVPLAEDQHMVQALAPQRAHEPLRAGIRPRRPDRRPDHPRTVTRQDRTECRSEPAIPVPNQEPEAARPLAGVHQEVAGLPGGPGFLPDKRSRPGCAPSPGSGSPSRTGHTRAAAARCRRAGSRRPGSRRQGARGHDPVQPQAPGRMPGQGGERRTISPVRPRARGLPTQHRDLVPQHEDLRVLGGVTARQQHQPAEHPDHEQADEANEHKRRA